MERIPQPKLFFFNNFINCLLIYNAMGLIKKKDSTIDVLKFFSMDMADADRIVGGMIRLENNYVGMKYVSRVLKLANNNNETCFVWYMIGVKIGMMMEHGYAVPVDMLKKLKKSEKIRQKNDVSIQ